MCLYAVRVWQIPQIFSLVCSNHLKAGNVPFYICETRLGVKSICYIQNDISSHLTTVILESPWRKSLKKKKHNRIFKNRNNDKRCWDDKRKLLCIRYSYDNLTILKMVVIQSPRVITIHFIARAIQFSILFYSLTFYVCFRKYEDVWTIMFYFSNS